ncbi:MAG: nucleotidyltransferase family protein [Prevotellaceae bacterium]|nr:nucleotidyltransferase family protein [Prevotellaceae bacterium]
MKPLAVNINQQRLLALMANSLNGTPIDGALFDSLSEKDWERLYQLAFEQTVLGITFDSIEKLPVKQQPPKRLLLKWFTQTTRIEAHYEHLSKTLIALYDLYQKHGIHAKLIKGHYVSACYPKPAQRQSGDIDLFVGQQSEAIEQIRQELNAPLYGCNYEKHSAFLVNNVKVENHYLWTETEIFNGKKCFMQLAALPTSTILINIHQITVPSPTLHALLLIVHPFGHFHFGEGVGLRHVCDWMMFCKKYHTEIDFKLLNNCLKSLKLTRFEEALSTIAVVHLGANKTWFPNTIRTNNAYRWVLKRVLTEGNFGAFKEVKPEEIQPTEKWLLRWYKTKKQIHESFEIVHVSPFYTYIKLKETVGFRICKYVKHFIRKMP